MIALYFVKKIGEHWWIWCFRREFVEFLPPLGRNFTIVVHSAHWCSETNWNVAISN